MKWTRGQGGSDLEDLRGQAPAGRRGNGTALKLGGGGAVVAIVVALISQALGVDLSGLVGGGGGGGGTTTTSNPSVGPNAGGGEKPTPIDPATDPDAELKDFIGFVIKDTQDTFAELFRAQGKEYRRAKLVLFTDAVDTSCGLSSSAIGPFYCPPDEKAYIDLTFYRDLKARFEAPGDFAQAYVIAHEIGHHLQNILGIDEQVRRLTQKNKSQANALSVKQELQADCFAGVWAHSAKARQLLELGDAEEALKAATEIGDDRLQKRAGAPVNAETFTHGSSAQRVRWFGRGMASGKLEDCDTLTATSL